MAVTVGDITVTSRDTFFNSFKIIMVDGLGFVCESDTGSDSSRIMIFSLSGHYHRIKYYWSSDTLVQAVLKVDHTTAIATCNIGTYQSISGYEYITYNNLKYLQIVYNNVTVALFAYCTASTKKMIMWKSVAASAYFIGVYENFDVGSNSIYLNTSSKTFTGKNVCSPVYPVNSTNTFVCDNPIDDVLFCSSTRVSTGGRYIASDGKKYIVSYALGVESAHLYRYE